jgi:UDP-glucose:(heptosyl)LPS alpha-1,3-glucosyltransferase
LLVVGAGQPGRFGRRARALGREERVRFAGGRADVLDCYRAADLLVHPAREENTGSVLLEASSQGVPVVCTSECGFAPHIERSRAGRVLSSPLEVEELATCCAELLGDGELRRALGERGREAARAFPMHRRTDAALAVIEAVAEKKRVAGVVPAQAR